MRWSCSVKFSHDPVRIRLFSRHQEQGKPPRSVRDVSRTKENGEGWLDGLAWRRTIELMRAVLGPTRIADRDVSAPWCDESAARFADDLAGSQTGASTAVGRKELRALVGQAIEHLEPLDRDI